METYIKFNPSRHISLEWDASGLYFRVGKFDRWFTFSIAKILGR